MRTTLIINDELAAAAKKMAADRRVSFSQIVNDALRVQLSQSKIPASSPTIPIFGGDNHQHHDTTPKELDDLRQDSFDPSR